MTTWLAVSRAPKVVSPESGSEIGGFTGQNGNDGIVRL